MMQPNYDSRPIVPMMPAGFASDMRIGDQEREHALTLLKDASEKGYFSVAEFDHRCQAILQAQTTGDLQHIFADIPDNVVATANPQRRASGLQIRLGLMGIWATLIPLTGYFDGDMAAIVTMLVPVVAILLFLMKVGPERWYEPSQKQLNEKQLRQLKPGFGM